MEDEKMIELFWQRSEGALTAVRKKYAPYCYSIAYRILRSNEDAEECVNDAMLRVWHAIPPARPQMLRTFIGKITRNLSLNYLEKAQAKKRGGGEIELLLSELEDCLPASGPTTEEQLSEQETIAVINRFLDETPITKRKIFVRRYWYGSSVKEIATDFGLTESNIATTLFRLRESLKTALEKEGILL